jgi:hypothetical protein
MNPWIGAFLLLVLIIAAVWPDEQSAGHTEQIADPLERALVEDGIDIDRDVLIDTELWMAINGYEIHELRAGKEAYKQFWKVKYGSRPHAT